MGSLTVRLPNSTHEQLNRLSKDEGVSIHQLVLTAVAEKLSALRTARFLDRWSNPPTREEYEAALARVPDAEPDPWDVWPTEEKTGRRPDRQALGDADGRLLEVDPFPGQRV